MKINTLKNGINTIFCNKNNSELALVGFVCRTGYINEYKNFPSGTAMIIEKLFLKGTHKNPNQKKIYQAIESIGARWYSDVNQELMSFYLLVPAENQFKAVSLISEIIQKSLFEEQDLEAAKHELIEEIKSIRKGTNVNFGLENLYTCFPYSSKKIGTIDQVMSITQNTILEYLSKQFRPSNCYLVVSGNYQQKACSELIEQEWSYWLPTVRKSEEVFFDRAICSNDLPKIPFLQLAKTETDLNLQFLLPEGMIPYEILNNPDIEDKSLLVQFYDNYIERIGIYYMILEELIAGNTGVLYSKLVLDERSVNHIQAELVQFSLSSCISIFANTENQTFNQTLVLMLECLEKLKKSILTSTELQKIKEMCKLNLLTLKNDLLESTSFLTKHYILAGYQIEINDIITKINYVEASQFRSFCIEVFNLKNLCFSIIGTNKEAKFIEKIIYKHLE
ncbi:MAG: M16 family metallopeptidase [Patescibacteria group bacterium]